jgi:hypothetical protein
MGKRKNRITFVRLFSCDDGTYVAEGDDGATWTFALDGDEWDVRNDLTRPETASDMDSEAWEAAGLPLSLDLEADTNVDVRNPVENAPSDVSPDAPPDPPEDDSVPPLPEGVVVPKVSGLQRVGTTVPFIVVPCALVAPAIRIRKRVGRGSAVKYTREDVGRTETALPDGQDKTETLVRTTTRVIDAVEEYRAVDSYRGRMRNRILTYCKDTCIGYLCPRDREPDLRALIAEVQAEIALINEGLAYYKLTDGCVVALIETDAAVAAQTVRDTLKDALDNLREAFARGDVDTLRSIATGLKGFDAFVNEEAAQKVEEAISEARKIARTIAREVTKKGRELEDVQRELSLDAIDSARFMLVAQENALRESDDEALPEVDGRMIEIGAPPDVEDDTDDAEKEVPYT